MREERAAREREAARKALEEELGKPAPRPGLPRTSPQIGADFMRIQEVNDGLAESVTRRPALDLKLVAKSDGEILKLAEQLKENLRLPAPDAESPPPAAEPAPAAPGPPGPHADLKSSLGRLDKLVLGFVRNPMFTNPAVFDLRHSKRASRQLEEIIALSGRLKRESEELRKSAKGSG